MIQSLLGVAIMSMAATSLLIAIRIGDNSLDNVKSHPLTSYEKRILQKAGYTGANYIDKLNSEISQHINSLIQQNAS